MNRRGFSLLELVISLMLTAFIGALCWSILGSAAFRLRDRSERMAMEHALRVGALAERATLEGLGVDSSAGSDLSAMTPNGFTGRAVRAAGTACLVTASAVTVRAGAGWWSAHRVPVAGRDSLLLGTVSGPVRWIPVALAAAPGSTICPDGSPATVLATAVPLADLPSVGSGTPVRIFEPLELRTYTSTGATWLGAREPATAGAIQPLAGPLVGTGVAFGYLTLGGLGAAALTAVGMITVQTGAITERAGGVGIARVSTVAPDSTGQTILLRNTP